MKASNFKITFILIAVVAVLVFWYSDILNIYSSSESPDDPGEEDPSLSSTNTSIVEPPINYTVIPLTVLWETHKTLGFELAEISLKTLVNQIKPSENHRLRELVIYNTHPDEVPQEMIQKYLESINVSSMYLNVVYTTGTTKNLFQDVDYFINYTRHNVPLDGYVYLTKSEFAVAKNFVLDVYSLISKGTYDWIWAPPCFDGKEFVTAADVWELLKSEKWFATSDIVGTDASDICIEPQPRSPDSVVMDTKVKFMSHHVVGDWSTHVFPAVLWANITVSEDLKQNGPWIRFPFLDQYRAQGIELLCEPKNSYTIHMYHSIKSSNHPEGRKDGRRTKPGNYY
jgi:hypothetical protein